MPTLLMPATGELLPTNLTRNLKFLYGSNRKAFTVNSAIGGSFERRRSDFDLSSDLLERDDHELGGLERREADDHVDDAEVDIRLGGGLFVALDEVRFARRAALKRTLAEQVVHERADVEPDLRPQRLVVGLEHRELEPAEQALLDEQRGPAHRDVLVVVRQLIRAAQRSRSPHHAAADRERAQAVDAQRVDLA